MRITVTYSVIIFYIHFILYKQIAKIFADKHCFQPIFSNRRANNASQTFICATELCFSRLGEKISKYSEKWAFYKPFILKLAPFFLRKRALLAMLVQADGRHAKQIAFMFCTAIYLFYKMKNTLCPYLISCP